MQIPEKVDASRAFIKKARNFIKYYPLRKKAPELMLLETINKLERIVTSSQDISKLEPISEGVKLNGNYQNPENLYQIEIVGEEKRVIVYQPSKFLGSMGEKEEVVYLYDIIVTE